MNITDKYIIDEVAFTLETKSHMNGDGAYTAAGSTITGVVPAGALGIARERQSNKEGWAEPRLAAYVKKQQKKMAATMMLMIKMSFILIFQPFSFCCVPTGAHRRRQRQETLPGKHRSVARKTEETASAASFLRAGTFGRLFQTFPYTVLLLYNFFMKCQLNFS